MMRTAAISAALVVLGLGTIVALAPTAGPPDGYWVFDQDGVRVDLPDGLRSAPTGGRGVLIEVSDGHGDAVLVARVPRHGRSLDGYVGFTVQRIRGGRSPGRVVESEATDVPGAEDAQRIVADYPQRRRRTTQVIAESGERFVTLSVTVGRDTPDSVIDVDAVVDSFEVEED